MTIEEFKDIITDLFDKQIDKWFDQDNFKDMFCKAAAKTFIKNNKDRYDNYLQYFADTNNNICINDFFDNFIGELKDITIDLTKFNIPLLPDKILIISKQDLLNLKNTLLTKRPAT